KCYQPGHAMAAIARHVFNAAVIVESFPQLVLGPLSDMSAVVGCGPIASLRAHKGGSLVERTVGQGVINAQLQSFLGNDLFAAARDDIQALPASLRPDAYDALLGLLPGLVLHGFAPTPNESGLWQSAVLLHDHPHSAYPFPARPERRQAVAGFSPWIES